MDVNLGLSIRTEIQAIDVFVEGLQVCKQDGGLNFSDAHYSGSAQFQFFMSTNFSGTAIFSANW